MCTDEDVNCTSFCMLNQVARLVSCPTLCCHSLHSCGHICTAQGFKLSSVKLYLGCKINTELCRYTWANLTPSWRLNRPAIQPSHPTLLGNVSKPFIVRIWVTGRCPRAVLCCGDTYRPAKGEQSGCDLGNVLLLPQIDCLEHVHIIDAIVLQCLLEPETYSQCC